MKLPAFQFYPADWRKDPGVQALSRHDQSVWFDMLLIMHESDERGVLLLNGKPIPEEALARMLNLDNQTCNQSLSTLLTYGVASRRETDGAIFSRRMVRDEKTIQSRREAGKKGGNPALLKQKSTTGDKGFLTPSSSFSSSPSGVSKTAPNPIENAPPPETKTGSQWSTDLPSGAASDFEQLQSRINALHPSWTKRPHFVRTEQDTLLSNSQVFFELSDRDWSLLAAYLPTVIDDSWGLKKWQPDNRSQFLEKVTDILTHADNWERECRRRGVPTGIPVERGAA